MEKRTDLLHIEPSRLKIEDGFNVRYDYGDIEGLAKSILENGVKVPLRVHKEKGSDFYIVTDGHRRSKAIDLAVKMGAKDLLVPVIPEGRSVNDESRAIGMIVYNGGKPLTLLEEALVYERLVNFGWTQANIAKKVGKTATHISNCMLLCGASTATKKKIVENKVSASLVIEELKRKSGVQVDAELDEALEKTGGKKVSNKHLSKPKKFSVEQLENVYEQLKDSGNDIDVSKQDAVYNFIKYLKGSIDEQELLNHFTI